MSLNLAEISLLSKEIDRSLRSSLFVALFQISEKTFLFEFERRGESFLLLLSLLPPFQRIHLSTDSKGTRESFSPLCKSLQERLKGGKIVSVVQLNQDRIVEIKFRVREEELFLVVELFSRHPNLYLMNRDREIEEAFYPIEKRRYTPPNRAFKSDFGEVRGAGSREIERLYQQLESEDLLKKKRETALKSVGSKIRQKEHSIANLQRKLTECRDWKKMEHQAELLKSYYGQLKRGMSAIELVDWGDDNRKVEIPLDKKLSPSDQLKKKFQTSKKLRKGVSHVEQQIKKGQEQIEQLRSVIEQIQSCCSLKELDRLGFKKKKKEEQKGKKEKKKPYLSFRSGSGFDLLVGRNSKCNEELTFSIAKGNDLWLHVADYPGSHVVICSKRGREVDDETVGDALQLALFYSKARERGEAEVHLTQRKHVSRLAKRKTGTVHISNYKTLLVKHSDERLQRLKQGD